VCGEADSADVFKGDCAIMEVTASGINDKDVSKTRVCERERHRYGVIGLGPGGSWSGAHSCPGPCGRTCLAPIGGPDPVTRPICWPKGLSEYRISL
jgi:hypothetical protein